MTDNKLALALERAALNADGWPQAFMEVAEVLRADGAGTGDNEPEPMPALPDYAEVNLTRVDGPMMSIDDPVFGNAMSLIHSADNIHHLERVVDACRARIAQLGWSRRDG